MYRAIASAALIWISIVVVQAPQSEVGSGGQANPTITFETAKDLAGKGRLDQAMQQLDFLARQNPEPAGVERLRAMIFYQRERFLRRSRLSAKLRHRIQGITSRLKCRE